MHFLSNCAISEKKSQTRENIRISMIRTDEEKN
jgi:hypothetical protein